MEDVKVLKVWFWNTAGRRERLTCDCGSDEFATVECSEGDGDAFECLNCGEYSRWLKEYRSERR